MQINLYCFIIHKTVNLIETLTFTISLLFFLLFHFHLFASLRYDVGHDGYLDLTELKIMMEKIGAPQTHLGLKGMIAEVDEDNDGKISFREFMLIYR